MSEQRDQDRRFGPDTRVWRNGDGPMPSWVSAKASLLAPNGTFLLETEIGRQRVHRHHLVLEHAGRLYSCPESEAREVLSSVRDQTAHGSNPALLVGPGKTLRSGSKKLTRSGIERTMRYPPPRGNPPSIEWIGLSDLQVDNSYQRSTDNDASRRLISSIATHWDWRLCMPLAVSRRDEGLYVIDGQHRLSAARQRGDIPHIPCCIARYGSAADEAGMFVAANRSRKAINRLDDFHAALVAGDEDALEVRRIINAAGLLVARQTGSVCWIPGEVSFTGSVQKIAGKNGERTAIEALTLIAVSFEGQVLSVGAVIFLALARLLIADPKLDRQRLRETLSARSMADWGLLTRGLKGNDVRTKIMVDAISEAYSLRGPHQIAA